MKRLAFLGAALAAGCGVAVADTAARLQAKNVCQMVAGIVTHVPMEGSGDEPIGRMGMFQTDGLIRQGSIDLDGDGNFEAIVNGDMGHHGGDLFNFSDAKGEEILEGGIVATGGDPSGLGAGFTSFKGRWYEVVFASEYGAFPRGVFAFEKGTLKRRLMCRFESDVAETMKPAKGVEGGDTVWCEGGAASDAKANRMKPVLTLNEAQAKDLAGQTEEIIGAYAGNSSYSGNEVFKPTAGPFAGKLLWRVTLKSDAGRGCTASAFYLIEANGASYRLLGADAQAPLASLQSDAGYDDAFYCGTEVQLFEKDGRMFVDRTSGDEKPATDEQLNHSIVEAVDGKPREVCSAEYDVTPRVTFTSPELPQ